VTFARRIEEIRNDLKAIESVVIRIALRLAGYLHNGATSMIPLTSDIAVLPKGVPLDRCCTKSMIWSPTPSNALETLTCAFFWSPSQC
jgi:hypothetical protein